MSATNRQDAKNLMAVASAAAEKAYAPYSKFRVGAAVQGKSGIYTGVNVENASLGLSLCAERSALAAAVAAGDCEISAVAIACIDASHAAPLDERMPCGACRQWLSELAPSASVHILGNSDAFRVADLLPRPFILQQR